MEEKTLRKLAILCSIIGLVLLYFASSWARATVDIDKITIDDIGKGFKVCGAITSKKVSNNHIFLDIEDSTGRIRYVIFNSTAQKLDESGISPYALKHGTDICAPGIADEYPKGSGRLELIYRSGNIEVY